MTVSEAISVNQVLTYMVGMKKALDVLGAADEAYGDVLEHAALLADKAWNALRTGVSSEVVRREWQVKE